MTRKKPDRLPGSCVWLVNLFDYGYQHEFEVEVVENRPQAEPGKYPRMIDSRGESPEQEFVFFLSPD